MTVLVGAKLNRLSDGSLMFHCPGCGEWHRVTVGEGPRPRWGWNGSGDAPTFTPSILVKSGHFVQPNGKHCDKSGDPDWPCDCICCHSFVTDGRIQFLSDCTHALAGQTVDLPDWPATTNSGGGNGR